MANEPFFFRSIRKGQYEAKVNLRSRRAWFDEQGEDGATNTDTAPEDKGGQGGQQTQTQTFTQADLDRIVKERLARAEESFTKKLLEELGIESKDNLKATVTAAKQRDDAEKSELQKAQEKLAEAERKRQEAEARAAQAAQERLRDKRDAEIKAALREARASKPDGVLVLMLASHAELVEAVADAEGSINKDALAKLVTAAKKEYAEMFVGGGPGSPSNRDGRVPDKDDKDARKRAVRQYRKLIRG